MAKLDKGTRLRRHWGYAFGQACISIGGVPAGILLLYYLTNVAGLRAGVAGLILALPKIWDALIDPMLGSWTDRLATRLGRRAPFLLSSGIVYLATTYLIFSLPSTASVWSVAAIATLLLIAASTSVTVFGVCQLSMASDMTSSATDLNKLLSLSNVTVAVLSIAASIMVPLLIAWSGGGRAGYSLMAAKAAGIAALFLFASVAMTRGAPVRPPSKQADTMPLFQSIRATARNHSFYYLLGYLIVLGTGSSILGAFLPYANQYVLHGNITGLSVLGGVTTAAGIIGFLLAAPLARWFGTKRWLLLGNLLMSCVYGTLFATSFGAPWLTWIALAGVGICGGALGVVLQTTLLRVMKFKIGDDYAAPMGIYLGIMLLATKLDGSVASFAAGELLEAIGFVSGGSHQSAATIEWLRVGYTLIPMSFFVIAGLFLTRIKVDSEPDDDGRSSANVSKEAAI